MALRARRAGEECPVGGDLDPACSYEWWVMTTEDYHASDSVVGLMHSAGWVEETLYVGPTPSRRNRPAARCTDPYQRYRHHLLEAARARSHRWRKHHEAKAMRWYLVNYYRTREAPNFAMRVRSESRRAVWADVP